VCQVDCLRLRLRLLRLRLRLLRLLLFLLRVSLFHLGRLLAARPAVRWWHWCRGR
jgi:hypothetical protein